MSEANNSRRISNRPSKRKNFSDENSSNGKKVRSCEKAGCIATEPTCCLNSNELCAESGYTSRWYHMSLGEHFCNNCFDHFYRPSKGGNMQFNKWSHEWGSVAKASKPTLKGFVASELLPYWLKCTRRNCGKWRKLKAKEAMDPNFIKSFVCEKSDSKSCDAVEDNSVALVLDSTFMSQIAEKPLLKNSPAAPFLRRFLAEDIGVCPINSNNSSLANQKYIEPFLMEQCGESSIWMKPGDLNEDEIAFTKQVDIAISTYLGLRNFLVAIWNLTPSKWLAVDKIHPYLDCRGLVRIYLFSVAEQMIDLLTKKTVINYGIILNPSLKLLKKTKDPQVLVIGAGVSGLAAAAHLHNLGVNVKIFEARSCLGGRVKDIPTCGAGAFFVQGMTNNPFATLAIQAKAEFQALKHDYVVFRSNRDSVPSDLLKTTKRQLNGLFQGTLESVIGCKEDNRSFGEALMDNHNKMLEMTPYFKDPELFKHLLSLKEIELKANLRDLSVFNWDCTTSLQGEEAFLPKGLNVLLIELASHLDISYDNEVKSIHYTGDEVTVATCDGETTFSKVLITVPLSVLQNGRIEFKPPLPESKNKAIGDLKTFYCEKLILEFSKKFWLKNAKKPFSKFGIISPQHVFQMFIDITSDKTNSTPTLVAVISEKHTKFLRDRSDEEIKDECMVILKRVFGKSTIPPSKWFLSHWKEEKFGGEFGSYLKIGSDKSTYDTMALSIDNKLYFAGEATFRNIPSTVTGAYLSGLREAAKIVKDLGL